MKKNHVRYSQLVIVGVAIGALCWGGLSWIQVGAPTESTRWIYECMQKKNNYAQSIESPKILIIAGSSALFGINAAMIEESSKIPTVNLAIHAGLGLDYLLKQVRQTAKSGDVVLLPLEYEMYNSGSTRGTDVLVDYVLARDASYLRGIPIADQAYMLFGISGERLYEGLKAKWQKPEPNLGGYQSNTLNRNGDETAKREPAENMLKKAEGERISALMTGIRKDSPAWENLSRFIEWAKENDVRVIATYPGILRQEDYNQETARQVYRQIRSFYLAKGVPVLGSAEDVQYERTQIFDSCYHLNQSGSQTRTRYLLEKIEPYLTDMAQR